MKKLISTLLLLSGLSLFGQVTIDSIEKTLFINNVKEVDFSKEEIESNIKAWVAKSYNNSKYVTRLSNEDRIILKAGFTFDVNLVDGLGSANYSKLNVNYDFEAAFKEGRYKLDINNIQLEFSDYSVWYLSHQEIGFYLMSKDEYFKYLNNKYNSTKGMEKAFYKRFATNEKKFDKQYGRYKALSEEIIGNIVNHLNLIELSIVKSFKDIEKEEDW